MFAGLPSISNWPQSCARTRYFKTTVFEIAGYIAEQSQTGIAANVGTWSVTFGNVRYCLLGRVSHGLGTDTQVPIHAAGELLGAAWRINLAVAEWAIHKRTLQSVRMAAVGSDPH